MGDTQEPRGEGARGDADTRAARTDEDPARSVPVSDVLREREERFRALTENAHDAILEISPDAKLLYVSPSFTDLFGWQPDEVLGTNAMDLVHPEDAADLDDIRQAAFATERTAQATFRYLHSDGSWRSVELRGRPYRNADGELRAVLVARDVSSRVAAERALQEQLETERHLAELSRRFVNVGVEGFETCVREGLESAARLAGADRAQFSLLKRSSGGLGGHYQWNVDGLAPRLLDDPVEGAKTHRWSARILMGGDVVHVPRVSDLPPEAEAERRGLERDGTLSYLAIPILCDAESVGFLDFFRMSEEGSWTEPQITRLRLVAEVLGSAVRRLHAEFERRLAEGRLQTLTRRARDTICEMSLDGRVLYISENFSDLCGYSPEELAGVDPWLLVDPEDVERLRAEAAASAVSDEARPALTYRIRHRDGGIRWLESSVRPFDAAGGRRHLAIVIRDVTERHERSIDLERQLELEKRVTDFSRALLESGSDQVDTGIQRGLEISASLAAADRAYLVTDVGDRDEPRAAVYDWHAPDVPPRQNPLGLEARKQRWILERLLRGETIEISRPEDLPGAAAAIRESLIEGRIRSVLCIPINSDGRLMGVLGFHCMREQTEWSPRQLTLLRLVADLFTSALRRKRAELSLQDSQQRLLQAQKMEAVGTLAGGIAHDFNNQLTVMLANARYVLRDLEGMDDDQRRALEDLSRAANHCAQLTRSLLHFSRRSPASPRTLDVGEVVADADELLRPLIPSSIGFELAAPDATASVVADPTQLQQVLVNLVINARDAMPDGGHLRLEVRARSVDAEDAGRLHLATPGAYVDFVVRDDGVGMDEETRARIFEPFFTTKELGAGTGLGLATAYGIVEQCGGAIAVESAPGEGATFHVLLPQALGGGGEAREEESREPAPASGTVLLAEDEEAVRRLLHRTLSEAGYRVLDAPDGAEALRLGRQHPVDALVTDVDMPRLGGIELARRLARQRPELPVLFISGSTQEEFLPGDPDAPVRRMRFLAKPFTEPSLLQALGELLSSS